MKITKEIPILIADDDQDDVMMLKELFAENNLVNPLYFVSDGVDLLDFLNREGKYENIANSPRPGIIMLSINIPKIDGLMALEAIKSNEYIKDIPIVVMTSSAIESNIASSWEYVADSYIKKPIDFDELLTIFRKLRIKGILIQKAK